MLEVKELQYFVVCADLSSFSRAAEVLYTTQPNVSKVIRSLEEKLGFEVFERDNRRCGEACRSSNQRNER